MSINDKIETLAWFAKRPSHWQHAAHLTARKVLPDHDSPELRDAARRWAEKRAVPVEQALAAIGLRDETPALPTEVLEEGAERAAASSVKMGGAGDLRLLHAAVRLSGARRVVETGVAYGWSSLAILAAFDAAADAMLVSVDMPYAKMNNEAFVGIAVPDRYRTRWRLIREPDRNGLKKAIACFDGMIDLAHYDSDKSWWGRKFAYKVIWRALGDGGIFISDDIQDNFAFRDFVEKRQLTFAITEASGKYVGVTRKAC